MSKKYNYVIVDATNLFFKSYHSIIEGFKVAPNLVGAEELSQTVNLMLELIKHLKSEYAYDDTDFYFLFDNSQTQVNIRKLIDNEYKSPRDKRLLPKNIYSIIKYFGTVLKVYSNHFHLLYAEALEADDLTKPLIEHLSPTLTKPCLVVSDDMDWSRNISDATDWSNWSRLYNDETFYSRYGFHPTAEAVCLYKSFVGDPSDNIKPAIPYLKHEMILDIMSKCDSLADFFKQFKTLGFKEPLRSKIERGFSALRTNYHLVNFHHIEKPIETYITYCVKDKIQCKIFLKSLNIEIPPEFLTEAEVVEDFFEQAQSV